jgi:hypothetical protein
LAGALALSALAVLLATVTAAASVHPRAAASATGNLTATYSGQWDETQTVDYTSIGESTTVTLKFHYAETEVINPHAAHGPIVGKPTLTVTGGSETVTGTHDPQDNCTATLTAAPANSSQPPIYFSRFDEVNGKITASRYLPGPVDMKSTVTSGSSAFCGQAFPDDSDDSADWTMAVHPTVAFPTSRALPATFPFPVTFHGTSSEAGVD